ncbi:hypothetical protein B484DRAFT_393894 [Ochromonadaceae sp. CCMP2298]|nr:hypothetical protein B484DRAFT_396703 [Ochromonadaceae sp. CCMP2298]KAJ1434666.1 hypothetical protein B484DRAFT_393894 [Ochromonadaceae sp. CCMP2298]
MLDLLEYTHTYTGEHMNTVVRGSRLVDPTIKQHIISYHDECCAHASDAVTRRWMVAGKGGKMKDKSRSPARMVAGYVCAEIGMWKGSLQFINPGKNKDGWWDGEDTQRQAAVHLLEFDVLFAGCICVDVYDNFSGHNCLAKDALLVEKLNKDSGGAGKTLLVMRDGSYLQDGSLVLQSFFLKAGDTLHSAFSAGKKCIRQLPAGDTRFEAPAHQVGEVLGESSELIGVKKGLHQILHERGVGYTSGACKQEKYRMQAAQMRKNQLLDWQTDRDNEAKLLELNPIERIWGRMKWYLRKYNTGKLHDLAHNMDVGLSPYNSFNFQLQLMRRKWKISSLTMILIGISLSNHWGKCPSIRSVQP